MNSATMRAAAVDEFGPPNLRVTLRPVPEPGPDEITIDVDYAVVGFVDTRAGGYGEVAAVHQAIADRRAPAKTVLSVAP